MSEVNRIRVNSDVRPPVRMLTVAEVSQKLAVRPSWTYAHAAELGGRKLFGLLRFDESALDQWISDQSLMVNA